MKPNFAIRVIGWWMTMLAVWSGLHAASLAQTDAHNISTDHANQIDRLDALLTAYHDAGQFSGAVAIRLDNGLSFDAARGMADHAWSVPNTPETRFQLASLSKVLTATLIHRLVDEGRLSLDDTVSAHIAELNGEPWNQISIASLLSHTSGLKREVHEDGLELLKYQSRANLIAAIAAHPLRFEPGTNTGYSNAGYVLLRLIAESASGDRFDTLLQSRIFTPAGMTESGIYHPARLHDRLAEGYDRLPDGYARAEFRDPSTNLGAAGLYSTVRDLVRFDRALRNGHILSNNSLERSAVPIRNRWATGWRVLPAGRSRGWVAAIRDVP